jgi:hypothetical protein
LISIWTDWVRNTRVNFLFNLWISQYIKQHT